MSIGLGVFFKQKTAYEIRLSLVGSEMCIRDSIETAVNGGTDVRRVRSASSQGFSFVWVEFDWGTDIFKARQIVSEKLISVSSQMPLGVGQPALAPQSSVMGEIFFIGMQADSTSMMDLRTIAEWNVKPLISVSYTHLTLPTNREV